jgi:hypothetical protein
MLRFPGKRRLVLCASLAFLLAGATTQTASAVESGRVVVSSGPIVCVQGESKFNWTSGGFADHSAGAVTYARNPGSCSGTLYRPMGWLATRLDVFKWTGTEWALCRSLDWSFGGGGDRWVGDIWYEQAATQWEVYSGPPCGAGFYGTVGVHRVWDGSAWQGGSTWSGNTSAGSAPRQLRVEADGTVGLDRRTPPLEFSVIDSNGQLVKDDQGQIQKQVIRVSEMPPAPKVP